MEKEFRFLGQTSWVDFTLMEHNYLALDETLEKNKVYKFDFEKHPKIPERMLANALWEEVSKKEKVKEMAKKNSTKVEKEGINNGK